MHLFRGCSLTQVLWKLMKGVRLLCPETVPATQRGHQPAALCPGGRGHGGFVSPQSVSPWPRPRRPGAFWKGLRLMGLDGTDELVADTPAHEGFFGRHTAGWGSAAFPQLKAIHLVEIGTHAIVDSGIWPVHSGEKRLGQRLLRSLRAGMLVLWDCGFHSYAMVQKALDSGAHILTRLPANVRWK